jgi:hypothetical protein
VPRSQASLGEAAQASGRVVGYVALAGGFISSGMEKHIAILGYEQNDQSINQT